MSLTEAEKFQLSLIDCYGGYIMSDTSKGALLMFFIYALIGYLTYLGLT